MTVSPESILAPQVLAKAQTDYEAALERIRAHAEIHFRCIKDPGRHDDAIANAVGIGWKHWLSAIRHGKDPNEFVSSIADKAVRQVRSGRRIDRHEATKDAMSACAQRRKGFTIQSLPETDTGVDGNSSIDALRDNTFTPPPEQAAFREQWGMFIDKLGRKKRPIVEDMAAGEDTKELAAKHKVSAGRVSQIRREAEREWQLIDGEDRGR